MGKDSTEQSSQAQTKIIHVKVIDGSTADVYEIGQALKKFKETVELPFRLEFIISDDKVELRDVDDLVLNLQHLQAQIKHDKRLDA